MLSRTKRQIKQLLGGNLYNKMPSLSGHLAMSGTKIKEIGYIQDQNKTTAFVDYNPFSDDGFLYNNIIVYERSLIIGYSSSFLVK